MKRTAAEEREAVWVYMLKVLLRHDGVGLGTMMGWCRKCEVFSGWCTCRSNTGYEPVTVEAGLRRLGGWE